MKKQNNQLKLRQLFICVLSIGLLAFQISCKDELADVQNEEAFKEEMNNSFAARTFSGDSLLLENPYSTENMTVALQTIKDKNPEYRSGEFDIHTTHYYLKFTPENEEEVGLLKSDSTIHYFDYRLDAEYREGYLKNRTPDSDSISVYYTAVPVGKVLPNVNYEVLSELYIPEQDPYFNDTEDIEEYQITEKVENKTDLFNHLLYYAFAQTGNEQELMTEPDVNARGLFSIFASKWYPSGSLKVNDDIAGIRPVTGAQVLIRQWFTVRQGITDGNGNFSTGWVKGKAKYVIQWERYDYSVRNGSLFQAETDGPNVKQQAWHKTISGGDDEYHAIIHQAANDFYYGYRFGLISPPRNNHAYNFGLQRQVKIAAREINGGAYSGVYSHAANSLTFGLYPTIGIRMWTRPSDQVYGTTIHELAHGLHSVLDKASYDFIVHKGVTLPGNTVPIDVRNSTKRLLETWPRTVEILMTTYRYNNYTTGITYAYTFNNYQERTINNENHYTSGGYDLIDNLNQRVFYNNNAAFPVDQVSGYSAVQLQNALLGAKSWNNWRDKIKSNYDNTTEPFVDELFANWQD